MAEGDWFEHRRTLVFGAALALGGCGGGGSTAPAAPAPAAFRQEEVVVASINTQMQANLHYEVAARGSTPVTLALPVSPAPGDWVSVRCVTETEWRIAQAAGQTIVTTSLEGNAATGVDWTSSARLAPARWACVGGDASGALLLAGVEDGPLYASRDGGTYWGVSNAHAQPWSCVAISPDGSTLLAAAAPGRVFISRDMGWLWLPLDIAATGTAAWRAVALSPDARVLAAAMDAGPLYVSQDSGLSWATRGGQRAWRALAFSHDMRLWAAAVEGDAIFTSGDAGASWVPRTAPGAWCSVSMSASGQVLAAAERGTGRLAVSRDGGMQWQDAHLDGTVLRGDWRQVAVSGDGGSIVAARQDGGLVLSVDGGSRFRVLPSGGWDAWRGVTISHDGNVLAGTTSENDLGGRICTSRSNRTTMGPAGGLTGGRSNSIVLEYEGNGRFQVSESTGRFVIR